MISVLIVADDLTGAADTAVGFTGSGRSVAVSLAAEPPACDVVAVDTDTRRGSPEEAAAAVRRAVERAPGAQFLYDKVDSTLRGNVAAELAAFVAAAPSGLCLFAPAFPATGRTTDGGVQYVHGVPLDRTEMWRLARRPAPVDVDSLVQAAGLRGATARLPEIRAGVEPLRKQFASAHADGAAVVVCDAERDDDLAVIAQAGTRLDVPVQWAGSGGLAAQLARLLPDRAPTATRQGPEHRPPAHRCRILAVVGSASDQAKAQARGLTETGLARVDVPALALVEDDGQQLAATGRALTDSLARRDVVVTISGGEVIGERGAARAAVTALARLVAPSLVQADALVVTGGETARALLRAGGVEWFTVQGQTEAGVVHGTAQARDRRWRLVTKAGAFGDESALSNAVAILRAEVAELAEGSTP